jgi:hypothetical protein
MVFLGGMGKQGELETGDQLGLLDHVALAMEGPSTPGGGRVPAPQLEALSYSILASLEEHSTTTKEERPTTCACLCTQNTALPSGTKLEYRDIPTCMEQSISIQDSQHMTTMSPVLCAMCPPDPLWL